MPIATRMGKASSICVGKKMEQMMYSPMYPPPGMPLIATELNTATSRILIDEPRALKRDAEHAEEERDLQHAAEARAVHVHRRAQRQDEVGDVTRDTAVFRRPLKFVGIVATDEQVPSAVTAGRRICRRMTRTPSFPPPR